MSSPPTARWSWWGGMPFRDAYHHVKANLHELQQMDPDQAVACKTHLGAPAGLDYRLLGARVAAAADFPVARGRALAGAYARLLGTTWPLA
jgi:hypothetical protein